MDADGPAGGAARPATILQRGRAKAYRPLPPEERNRALHEALGAFQRGDFFEAHELLEPAWMGSPDLLERELHSGLIKLAAAYVHAVRGNARGIEKNLRGARDRLTTVLAEGGPNGGLDLRSLIDQIDVRLAAVAAGDPAAYQPPLLGRFES